MDPQLKADLIALCAVAGPLLAAWIKAKIDEKRIKNSVELATSQKQITDAQSAGFILSLAQRAQGLDEKMVAYEQESGAAARREVQLQVKLNDCQAELQDVRADLVELKVTLGATKNESTTT